MTTETKPELITVDPTRKVTTGPSYPCNWPIPVGYYKWTCPECGDICEDPAQILETCCHNGHIVKITLATDYAHDRMVAEYEPQSQVPCPK